MENIWQAISSQVVPGVDIAGVNFNFYGLVISVGIIMGITLSQKILGKERGWFWIQTMLFGLVGARIYHLLSQASHYRLMPDQIMVVTGGGWGILGAIVGALISTWVYARWNKINFFRLTDKLALAAPIAQAIGRWGNFFNMEAFGPPSNLPWGIFISPDKRPVNFLASEFFHPLFLYESILNLGLFGIMVWVAKSKRIRTGWLTGIYLLGFGLIRLLLENFRLDTWVMGDIKVATVISLVMCATGLILLRRVRK